MQLAISTTTLSYDSQKAVALAAELGFTCVELNLQQGEFGYSYRRKTNVRFYRQLRKTLDGLGLGVWSATLPPLTQEQMFDGRARKEMLISGAIAAGTVGAKVYVVRPADIFTTELGFETYIREDRAPAVIEGYDESWAQTVNRRMRMALLNLDHWIGAPLTNQAARMAKVTEDLAIGWAMDVRRALNRNKLDVWLEAVGERLVMAYLYDLENGRYCPPLSDEWQDWLPTLQRTRLQCAVIHAPDAIDEMTIARSREYIRRILGGIEVNDDRDS